jgi:hypothetical protein
MACLKNMVREARLPAESSEFPRPSDRWEWGSRLPFIHSPVCHTVSSVTPNFLVNLALVGMNLDGGGKGELNSYYQHLSGTLYTTGTR